ncbi:hypothetical protein [Fictibacillus barbaricus]|uniref:Uncharacterized protein n=1 Tax=Fictibacillus barbaricus TaxID=182136 RepID=A0ABU1TWJ3_9BACL|nr:hypothetical protein [Fictibacillus barbaricus]MDR7071556.1 hypothetical protein [Fictibacillus barbaricus]
MRKFISVILFCILLGCSATKLEDAISSPDLEKVSILYQDDNDEIVIFLSKNAAGGEMISLNKYTKTGNVYGYDVNGEFAVNIDRDIQDEFLTVSPVGNSSIKVFWGFVFNYQGAETVKYSLEDEAGNILYESSIRINKNHIVIEKLPKGIDSDKVTLRYQVLDHNGKVLVER